MDRMRLARFILTTDRFTRGEKVEEFERTWSKWLGAKYSLNVTSGSTANFLLVASIIDKFNVKKGNYALMPASTWPTNVNPVIQFGLNPIFCDINLRDFSFDIESLEGISSQYDIRMVFVTHLLGYAAANHCYRKIFPDAIIIDDVCEAHGCLSFPDGKKVGADSLGATFSFYFGHHMSTIEGGMISTCDEELYDLMKMKGAHGMSRHSKNADFYALQHPDIDRQFLFPTDGYNFRSNELMAVLGLSQLKRLDESIAIRRSNYARFCNLLEKYESYFYPLDSAPGNSSFCLPFVCKTRTVRNRLVSLFAAYGIEYRPIVGGNLLRQPYLTGYKLSRPVGKEQEKSNVDILHDNGLYIGNNQFVGNSEFKLLENLLDLL